MNEIGLIKFGQEEHISRLKDQGTLYFNKIDYFRTKENDHRFDQFEGYDRIVQARDITNFSIDGQSFEVDPQQGPICFQTKENWVTHICCFSILASEAKIYEGIPRLFDPRLTEFGNSFALVLEVQNFLNQLEVALIEQNIVNYRMDRVEYYPVESYTGKWNPFKKPIEYAYQQEYRIAIQSDNDQGITISIGKASTVLLGPIGVSTMRNEVVDGIAIIV